LIDRELLQSKTAKAIEHYEKFLDLWKDADPGIAEVEDAKKRVAKMKGERGVSNPQLLDPSPA